MSEARQNLGTRVQCGNYSQCAGSLVPKAQRTHRSPATRLTVDESNQGKKKQEDSSRFCILDLAFSQSASMLCFLFFFKLCFILQICKQESLHLKGIHLSGWFLTFSFLCFRTFFTNIIYHDFLFVARITCTLKYGDSVR